MPDLVDVGPGWYQCTEERDPPRRSAAYYLHDHGDRLVSHYPRDKGCTR